MTCAFVEEAHGVGRPINFGVVRIEPCLPKDHIIPSQRNHNVIDTLLIGTNTSRHLSSTLSSTSRGTISEVNCELKVQRRQRNTTRNNELLIDEVVRSTRIHQHTSG